jgi:hypothetical protein
MTQLYNVFMYLLLALFMMGWIDWLWLFGVQDSQSWTWWQLIYFMAN